MNMTAIAVWGYILWLLLLLVGIVMVRSALVASKKKAVTDFAPDGGEDKDFLQRLTRAHANTVECFPFVAGIMLLALATGQSALTDPLALVVLAARVAQSTIHLISVSALAIQVRFATFLVQIAVTAYWAFLIFPHLVS